jgi:hypothetical protein
LTENGALYDRPAHPRRAHVYLGAAAVVRAKPSVTSDAAWIAARRGTRAGSRSSCPWTRLGAMCRALRSSSAGVPAKRPARLRPRRSSGIATAAGTRDGASRECRPVRPSLLARKTRGRRPGLQCSAENGTFQFMRSGRPWPQQNLAGGRNLPGPTDQSPAAGCSVVLILALLPP